MSGLVCAAVVPTSAAITDEAFDACRALQNAEVIFLGRAQPAFAYRLSFEKEIQQARGKWQIAKKEWERYRASHPNLADDELDIALLINALDAESEFQWTEAHYPSPIDMVLTPMQVETAFRGTFSEHVYVDLRGLPPPLEAGRSYLFYGQRTLTPFESRIFEPTLPPREAAYAGQERRILEVAASATHGGIVYGDLTLDHALDSGRVTPLAGVRIRLSSPGFTFDTVSDADGIFLVEGIPSGPLNIAPDLPKPLTIADRSSRMVTVPEGGCVPARLRATHPR